jgi:integrase
VSTGSGSHGPKSELFGLKWGDVHIDREELSVVRSIVFGVVGRCKTESSQKPVPLHSLLGETLLTWRKACKFTGTDDWVFASRLHKGRRPYWGACILRKYIRPVAASLKIQKRIGWHLPAHLFHSAQERRSRVQSDAGANEALYSENDAGCLHAGGCTRQARRASGRPGTVFFPITTRADAHITGNG